MISIVLYGRNDSYGYNLHKRAALSLNCVAEVLTDPSDEILFVDYNTPDDFPTFPEAIQDTLTPRAKELLRILRVRPRIHERFKSKTRLLALEPIARNVAVRRSSGSNRWILSTNTDMIFVPLHECPLSTLASDLAPGFYHTPRIEIPEVLWESLNRNDPVEVINTVRTWGSSLHLNEIVLGSKVILYDGPGDFQLLLRSDLFENHGFDEEMLLGWHVDSNIAARMHLKYGRVGDLGSRVYGYHCDHTSQVTPAHSHTRLQNDWRKFVAEITRSDIPSQADSWGCAEDNIEEIRLSNRPSRPYTAPLRRAVGSPLTTPNIVKYGNETYNKVDYDPRHMLPFLVDLFAPASRNTTLAWHSCRWNTLSLFASVWEALSFTGRILVSSAAPHGDGNVKAVSRVSLSNSLVDADAFVFDFGGLPPVDSVEAFRTEFTELYRSFRHTVRAERVRLSLDEPPRRIIVLNALNSDYERLVGQLVMTAATPFSTRVRHGFVLPTSTGEENWLPLLTIGEAGLRAGAYVESDPAKRGWIASGPFKYIDEGTYTVKVDIELLEENERRLTNEPCVYIEVCAGSELLALRLLRRGDLTITEHKFSFVVPKSVADGAVGIEARIAALKPIAVIIHALHVEQATDAIRIETEAPAVLRIANWLPYLRLGPLGQFNDAGVTAQSGLPDFVLFGPYWSLPIGQYVMEVQIDTGSAPVNGEHLVRADILVGNQQIALVTFNLTALAYNDERSTRLLRLPFRLDHPASLKRRIETRIWSSGEEQFTIRSLCVHLLKDQRREELLPFLLPGNIGHRAEGQIRNMERRSGLLAYSPTMTLRPGAYKLFCQAVARRQPDIDPKEPCAIVIVQQGPCILAVATIGRPIDGRGREDVKFEVLDQPEAVEFTLQVVAEADVELKGLAIEPTAAATVQVAAACQIEDWLPFLQTGLGQQMDSRGFDVRGSDAGLQLWGPNWTLPAGCYELLAAVVPHTTTGDGAPAVTIEVCTEGGQRSVAVHQWWLGRFLPADRQTALECRLPFELGDKLSVQSRTIQTRLFTSGGGRFHVRSLSVRKRMPDHPCDWFMYLTAGECGIRTDDAIGSDVGKIGCIATTPPLELDAGHYEVRLNIGNRPTDCAEQAAGSIEIEIRSGLDVVALDSFKSDSQDHTRIITFDIASYHASLAGIEITIRAASPAAVSIFRLQVAKLADKVTSAGSTPALSGNRWQKSFRLGVVGRATRNGVLAEAGTIGTVGYMHLPCNSGRYEVILRIKRVGREREPGGRLTISSGDSVLASRSLEFNARHLGPIPIPRGPFRVCSFEWPLELADKGHDVQIRVDSSGLAPFLINSIAVVPKTYLRDMRDRLYLAARRTFGRLRQVIKPI